ncbi:MAG: hypothetical protein PHN82_02575 [bacterium]|nr:hypothetical protein [bacterium]
MRHAAPIAGVLLLSLCAAATAQHGGIHYPGSMGRPVAPSRGLPSYPPSHQPSHNDPPRHHDRHPYHPYHYYGAPYRSYDPYWEGAWRYRTLPPYGAYRTYEMREYPGDDGRSITVDWRAYNGNATYRRHIQDMLEKGWRVANPR